MKHLRLTIAVLLLLFALAFAACGGDDDDDSGDDSAEAPTAADQTDADTEGDDDEPTEAGDEEPTEAPDDGDDDNGGGSANPSSAEVCALMTTEEVLAIMEQPMQAGVETFGLSGEQNACEWETVDTFGTVQVEVVTDGAEEWYDVLATEEEPYPGIGDKAYAGEVTGTLSVLEGDVFVDVQVVSFGIELDETAKAEEVARLVLERVE